MRFLGDLIHQDTAGIATAVRCEGTLLQALVAAVSAHIPAEPADSPAGKPSCLLAALQVTAPPITPNVSLLFLSLHTGLAHVQGSPCNVLLQAA